MPTTRCGDCAEEGHQCKRYRRDPDDKHRVLIDRYDAEDCMISVGEVERAGGPELWKGPRSLPQKATAAGLHAIVLAKEAKDQGYLRLLPAQADLTYSHQADRESSTTFIKERCDPLNYFILLLIIHIAARGKAQSVGEKALVDAGAVIGRARVERLHVHWFP